MQPLLQCASLHPLSLKKYNGNPFHGNIIQEAAKQVLLPPCEVEKWFKHLVTVAEMRKKGSKKAAETRQKNKKAAAEIHKGTNEAETLCGACKSPYRQYTTVIEDWICCDKCGSWFHYRCVGIEFVPERVFVNDFFLRLVHSLYYLCWNRMRGFEREIRPSSYSLF